MVSSFTSDLEKVRKEIGKLIIGQKETVNSLLRALLADGHVLVEGVPGIAKTLLIKALGKAVGVSTKRIQFTVDLLPSDITGITIFDDKTKKYILVKGPIFANFIVADEINRSPPKSQSALLEAMQEKQVTIGRETLPLPRPFFVMANNNPIESSGVYPLPEAQLDRFLFKLAMPYPEKDDMVNIIEQNITLKDFESFDIKSVLTPARILEIQSFTKKVKNTKSINNYIADIVNSTRDFDKHNIELGKYIEWAASPRAAIGLFIGAKADAVLNRQGYITPQNVKNVAHDVLRHRIILNYRGIAEGIKTDDIITEIIRKVPVH